MRIFPFVALVAIIAIISIAHSDGGNATKDARFIIIDKNGVPVDNIENIAKYLSKFDVVFFGEKHDSKTAHELELKFAELLYGKHKNFAIAMEMFEADNQSGLDDYLSGKIGFDKFAKEVRLWGNYDDYRPIVNFAMEHKIPIIAANIPRRLASIVAKNGIESWDSLPPQEKQYLPQKYSFDNKEYKQKFLATMQENPMMKHMGGGVMLDNLFKAQVVKDEKMAESISNYIDANPGVFVYMLCGSFHSDYRLGTVEKLLDRKPNLKVATISTVVIPKNKSLDDKEYSNLAGAADFTLLVKEQ